MWSSYLWRVDLDLLVQLWLRQIKSCVLSLLHRSTYPAQHMSKKQENSVNNEVTWRPISTTAQYYCYSLLRRTAWMLVMLCLVLSHYWYRTFIQTYSATSPFNPHWEMDKTFSPIYSSSQINYVEAEAVEFSRFRFHSKRTASTASASSFRFHIPGYNTTAE